jgi:hypothetical protein
MALFPLFSTSIKCWFYKKTVIAFLSVFQDLWCYGAYHPGSPLNCLIINIVHTVAYTNFAKLPDTITEEGEMKGGIRSRSFSS